MKKWMLLLPLIIASFAFCFNTNKKQQRLTTNYKNIEFLDFEIDHKYLITEVEVDRVKVGDSYKTHKRKLKKSEIENKESLFRTFDLYNREKEKIALVYIDSDSKKTIHSIEIISPKYKTEKGIGVGSTFKDIKKTYPNSETHGCEINGRTVVMVGDYLFLLEDTFFNSYTVDESKIHPSTRIKMITLRE